MAELSTKFGVHPTMISGTQEPAGELFACDDKAPAVEDAQKVIVERALALSLK